MAFLSNDKIINMENSKPWQLQKALTINDIRRILHINFPQLTVDNISFLGGGWDNTTWWINKAWVFRLPKHSGAAQLLRNEIKTLPHLPKLRVRYPKPRFICLEPEGFDYPFYGHRYLLGTHADGADLTSNNRIALAAELGHFLKQLHAFPVDKAKALGIGVDEIDRANLKKRLAPTKEHFHYLARHGLIANPNFFIKFFERYLDMKTPETVVLGHGDFYARHILLDDNKKLTAVIDWGDCELLSPAVDLRIVYQFLPLSAHQVFWDIYGNVGQTIQKLAQLCAIFSAVTIAWYVHQIQDLSLLGEELLGLKFISEAIDAET